MASPTATCPRPAKKPAAPKLTAAAVEATADAFLAAFKALPSKVQWRVVQLLEEYEDELDEAQLAADKAANPEDYDRKNSITLEEYLQEREVRNTQSNGEQSLAA
ncbi:hypothetical protein A0257_08660 [Hymenobacter psoromatis]|nr:hypothetical protein A0257_08660 [Hymenobacter psoromatis]